jgi:Abortive infection C-terminus
MRVLRSPQIPKPLTAFLAGVIAQRNTHGMINRKFQMYGAPGDPPDTNKEDKCLQWLDRAALDPGCDALVLVGGLLHDIMEPEMWGAYYSVSDFDTKLKESIETQLARHGFAYVTSGKLTRGGMTASPTRTLQDVLRQGDFPGVDAEFTRAIDSVEADPAAALTAACAILEALFKIIIHDDGLAMPSKETIGPLWAVVRKHLDFDAGSKDDDDIRKILQGLASVVDGIGAIRTHAGSAHGRDGRKSYRVHPRHGRLAIHAAHTLAIFVIETWKQRKKTATAGS